jgi:hypothetical protein
MNASVWQAKLDAEFTHGANVTSFPFDAVAEDSDASRTSALG